MNENLIDQIFAKEEKIGVAVSGGLDSVCLLSLCAKYAKNTGKKLVVLHVHHGIRKESDAEEKFVQNLAQSYGAEFCCAHVNVPQKRAQDKQTLEEAARELRYNALEKMAKKHGVKHVCLAHNSNDQAETILLHLSRGSGLSGACGMSELSGMYVRPILDLSRAELEKYATKNKLQHVEDASNSNTEYSRNFVRHFVLPKLEEIQPKAVEHLAMFAKRMQNVNEYIESLIEKPKILSKTEVLLSLEDAPQIVQEKQIHFACNFLGVCKDIEQKHIKDISELAHKQNGAQIHLPHGLVAWKTANGVVITNKEPKQKNTEIHFGLGEYSILNKKVCITKADEVEFGNGLYVDALKIPSNAVIRTQKEGDKFRKLGSMGSKKLVDYFTDKKIPQYKRKTTLVVASGSNILAVLPHDIAEGVKIDGQTEQILKITIEEKK